MRMKRKSIAERFLAQAIWFVPPLMLWALIVLPSSLGAVWGSLDDPGVLTMARAGFKGNLLNSCGERMLPVHFLNHWLFYIVGGADPSVWYFFQSLEFLLCIFLIFLAVGITTGRYWLGAVAATLLLTASPIAENVYTISKSESILIVFYGFLAVALSFWCYKKVQNGFDSSFAWRLACFIVFFVVIILCIFCKETAVSVLSIGVTGLLVGFIYRKRDKKGLRNLFWVFTLAAASSILTFFVLRMLFSYQTTGYTRFFPSISSISANLSYYIRQTPDVLLLGFLGLGTGVFASLRSFPANTLTMALAWSFLVGGFGQFATLLVWRWPIGYYMLPVAFWFCISLTLFMSGILDAFKISDKLRKRNKQWLVAILAIVLISRLYSVPYIYFIAHAQRSFDRQEDAIQEKVIKLDPIWKRLVDLGRIWFTEPPFQRTRLFNEKGKPDMKWIGAGELFHPFSEGMRRLYNNDSPPDLDIEPLRTGDLVLLQGTRYPFRIILRGIGGTITDLPDFKGKIKKAEHFTGHEFKEVFRLENAEKVFQPWTFRPKELVFRSVLYEVAGKLPGSYRWEGHSGGWLGREAKLKVNVQQEEYLGSLHIFIPSNSQIVNSVLPIKLCLFGDDRKTMEIVIDKNSLSHRVDVKDLLDGPEGEIKIEASKTWRPIELGINQDTRELSVMAEYIPSTVSYSWEGHYGDWLGREAKLKVNVQQEEYLGSLHIFIPSNSQIVNSVLPIKLCLFGDDRKTMEIVIDKNSLSHRVDVKDLLDGPEGEIKIEASKTWRPIELGINQDTRELSVMAEYIPLNAD